MSDANSIVRERQLVIRREIDRRGIALKAVALDSNLPYTTILSYFPGEKDKTPATIPASAIFAICEGDALPADLISLLLPNGWLAVKAPETIDHDELCTLAEEYVTKKTAAHRLDSECGRDIGPNEDASLTATVVQLRAAAA
ncbi:MAG: hypothetical protein J7500_15660 [Sphingomonas sp.]|nr:hypothetical protein [Sphingomonas sp.]